MKNVNHIFPLSEQTLIRKLPSAGIENYNLNMKGYSFVQNSCLTFQIISLTFSNFWAKTFKFQFVSPVPFPPISPEPYPNSIVRKCNL